MRKTILLLLALFVMLCMLTACQGNTTPPEAGTDQAPTENPATDFEYEKSSSGEEIYITKYIGTAEHVVIPAKIEGLPVVYLKGIFDQAGTLLEGTFEGSNIKTISLPASIRSIYGRTFKNCSTLSQVIIPADSELNYIIDAAFMNCTAIESLDLSSIQSLKIICGSAFEGCTSLRKIKLPDHLITIEKRAFYGCSSLSEIYLPKELEDLGDAAFAKCTSLKIVSIPAKVKMIAMQEPMFYENPALEKIIFEEGRESMEGYAFFDITSGPEIVIPKSVSKFSAWVLFIHGDAKLIFEGDCPEIIQGQENLTGTPTIYYDPSTNGWDTCVWKDRVPMLPIE
jgi:hypothetical protein